MQSTPFQTGRREALVIGHSNISERRPVTSPIKPTIDGLEAYTGKQYQTSRWPRQPVDFNGQRVGVIGTGSTGIRCIPLIAQQARELCVFQRTVHFSVPLQNCSMQADFAQMIKSNYAALRRVERNSFGGFVITNHSVADNKHRSALETSAEARQQEYEYRWRSGGLCFYSSYRDLLFNKEANDTLADFVRAKIREKVHDPVLVEKLTPRGTPIMTKRACADTHYYDTFNRDNVTLVDISRSPIEQATSQGLRCGGSAFALDSIVFATGFDAVSGTILRIDIRGRDSRTIQEPRVMLAYLGGYPAYSKACNLAAANASCPVNTTSRRRGRNVALFAGCRRTLVVTGLRGAH